MPMNGLVAYLPYTLLLLGLVVPSAGPLVDHHFSDMQPGHKHMFLMHSHLHVVAGPHSHPQVSTSSDIDYSGPATLYNYSNGLLVAADTLGDVVELMEAIRYAPSAIFNLELFQGVVMMGQSVSLTPKPPQPIS